MIDSHAPVAQRIRAAASGAVGRGFESLQAHLMPDAGYQINRARVFRLRSLYPIAKLIVLRHMES
jgi:hypothetical protein